MGTDTRGEAVGRCARSLLDRPHAHMVIAHGTAVLALGSVLFAQAAGAQVPAEAPPPNVEQAVVEESSPAPNADPTDVPAIEQNAVAAPRPKVTRPALVAAPAEPQPPAESAQALAARIEALEKLAEGTLPQVALDSVLTVSLDDDSSMIERDAEARAEHRRLTVALNQAERAQNKPEAELEHMRNQIHALELERKVLSLPIEVRERLVQESYQASLPKPVEQVAAKAPEKPPVVSPPTPPPEKQKVVKVEPKVREGQQPSWLSGLPLFLGLSLVAFALARFVGTFAKQRPRGFVDLRRERGVAFLQLGICSVGVLSALVISFRQSPEILGLALGALLLVLLATKDVGASLLGGLVLFFRRPFELGHRIEVAEVAGRVTDMRLLFVRVLTSDQRSVDIPNREFLRKRVNVSSASALLQPLQIDFYLKPQEDIASAKKMILEVVQSTPGVDTTEGQNSILVSQVAQNGAVMVRLRATVFFIGTRPEQEIASEISERGIARLRGNVSASAKAEVELADPEKVRRVVRTAAH